IYTGWDARERGAHWEHAWDETFTRYSEAHPELAHIFQRRIRGDLPESWEALARDLLQQADEQGRSVATRKASQMALNGFGLHLPELMGGSADLTESNNTWWDDCTAVSRQDGDGNYLYYGV